MKRRVLILAAASLLLVLLLGQLNHYLALWQVHVWCGGLFVTFAALRLSHRLGATTAFIAGLVLDANAPVPFGTQAFLFLSAHAVIFTIRARAPREETLISVLIALVANLGLFLALSFVRIDSSIEPARAWFRVFADLLASQLVLALIGPWYFSVQARLLEATGANLRRDFSHRAT
jgi:rod shape-determining protein MreD